MKVASHWSWGSNKGLREYGGMIKKMQLSRLVVGIFGSIIHFYS